MTWEFPHRTLACYSMLPLMREALSPRLLDACTKWIEPQVWRVAHDRGYRLTTCDIAPGELCVEKQDILKLTYKDGTFRGVISCDTLEHVEDMDGALSELYRVTEPGGFLILCLPVCFLGNGKKRQVTERAEPGDANHHVWRVGMDMELRAIAPGYKLVARMECLAFDRMHMSALWLLEKRAEA